MARKVKDKSLDTREARSKLKPQGKPYYRLIEPGLHLGYRRLKGRAGTWVARHYKGDQEYETESIGTADDFRDADGLVIFDWWQAVERVRLRMVERARHAAGKPSGPYTVDNAFDDYFAGMERDGRSTDDARTRYRGLIEPVFGAEEAGKITTNRFEKWLDNVVKQAPRVRTKKGEQQRHKKADTSTEGLRKRRASARRIWNLFRAALNAGFQAKKIPSDAQWKTVKTFKDVDGVRLDYLSIAESMRLINACDPDFRGIVQAGLLTGARYGALAQLTVADFDPDAGTVRLQTRKGRGRLKVYHCHLTQEGQAFFRTAVAGRNDPHGLIFLRADLGAWAVSNQKRRMAAALKAARIGRRITFHHLRHTWASLAVMGGTPLLVVAQNLGHSDTRMVEKHYGHLAPSYRKQEILKGAPVFGIEPGNVVAIG